MWPTTETGVLHSKLMSNYSSSSDEISGCSSEPSECNTGYTSNMSSENFSENESSSEDFFHPDDSDDESWHDSDELGDEESTTESESDHTSLGSNEEYPDELIMNQDSDCDSDDDDVPWLNLCKKLVTAVKLERLASVLNVVEDGAGVSCQNEDYTSPLHHAVRWGYDTVVVALLMTGMHPNLLYNDRSPLLLAVDGNEREIAKVLLDAGAYVNFRYQKSTRKRTLLHRAVRHKHGRAMAELLLDYGANVNAKDATGESVLCCAANNDYIRMNPKVNANQFTNRLELLISRGANPLSDHPTGENSSFEAVLRLGPLDAVKLFLNSGIKLENFRDKPFLHIAITNPFTDVIEFILDSHVFDIDMKNSAGRTALFEAAKNPENVPFSHLKMLLQYGADPNSPDESGQSPLLVALRLYRVKTVQQLLEYGARLDRQTLSFIESDCKKYKTPCLYPIVAHLALFESQNHDLDSVAGEFVNVCGLKSYYEICQAEVLSLKESAIYDQFTYYKLLVSENIYRIANDKVVKKSLKDPQLITEQFPIYGKCINRHFIRLQEKLRAMKVLGRLIGLDIHAFHHIYHNILHHLPYVDLQNLSKIS